MMEHLTRQFETDPDAPFFIFLSSQVAHKPLQAPEALIDRYQKVYAGPLEDLWNQRVSTLRKIGLFPRNAPTTPPAFSARAVQDISAKAARKAALMQASDVELGRLLQLLEDNGKLANTLILITSDNGAEEPAAVLSNAPLRGAKATLFEGGTRSPLIARWPAGGIASNEVVNQMATYLDITPTLLQAAGIRYPGTWRGGKPLPRLEGRNLLPLFRGEPLTPPEYFFWDLNGQFAVLHGGRWKLVSTGRYDVEKARQNIEPLAALYDVVDDPAETRNLAPAEKDMALRLMARYRQWTEEHAAVPYYRVLDERERNRANRKMSRKQLQNIE
jgi:arylsulfatase